MSRLIVLVVGLLWLSQPVALIWPTGVALCERHGADCSCPEVCALDPDFVPQGAMCHQPDEEEPAQLDPRDTMKQSDCSIKASCSDEEKAVQAVFSRAYLPSERFRWEGPCLFQEKLDALLVPGTPGYSSRISHPPRLS